MVTWQVTLCVHVILLKSFSLGKYDFEREFIANLKDTNVGQYVFMWSLLPYL